MRPLKKYGININKYVQMKKLLFQKKKKKKTCNECSKFQWKANYEKTTNFYLEQFYFIQNKKRIFNDKEHQKELICKLVQELIF